MSALPFRQLTDQEQATKPAACFGCGRDAITWVTTKDGRLLGYCGYLDSGACLAVVAAEAELK